MEKIENWLDSRIGLNFRTGLGRMEQAIRLFGHPEKAYPTIHVTGTNGKGIDSSLWQNLFDQHQKKVGTFTSPHMETVHDRICLNGQPISESDFSRLVIKFVRWSETHCCPRINFLILKSSV